MATSAEPALVKLSVLEDGQEAITFAALVDKVRGKTYKGDMFLKCVFRDRFVKLEAPLWADSRFLQQAESWTEGLAYRLHVRTTKKPKYGLQLEIIDIRLASEAKDAPDGYNFFDLVERTDQDPEALY